MQNRQYTITISSTAELHHLPPNLPANLIAWITEPSDMMEKGSTNERGIRFMDAIRGDHLAPITEFKDIPLWHKESPELNESEEIYNLVSSILRVKYGLHANDFEISVA